MGSLVVKKKSVLEPVKLGATPASASASASASAPASASASAPASALTASIVGKSKAGTKASLSKIGKLSLGSASERSKNE